MMFLFWICMALMIYAILGYPLVLMMLARIVGREPVLKQEGPRSFTLLIAAHNEEACIADKLRNSLELAASGAFRVQIIVVSDGSTDRTVSEALSVADEKIEVVESVGRGGKALALNQILAKANGDVIVFTDANSFVSPGALEAIATHFCDPKIGGVCGQISVDKTGAGAIGRGEGFYWRYDQALKLAESQLGGTVSAQGSFYAIRREFAGPLRPDCADDFFNSVRVVAKGKRLSYQPEARATEVVTERAVLEMGRRVRSTEGGWRAMAAFWYLMNPWRYGLYAWQLISHKLLRRLVPFFLAIVFATNLLLLDEGMLYKILSTAQIFVYGAILAAAFIPSLRKLPIIGALFFFGMSNLAMALGLLRFITGKKSLVWKPVR
ncbi:glycosyltransferase family 2 protein [Falsihalocynthiibacter sp. S25ZX9]|uniref:glycosyltransferase family 2 protein n=1 Tax=Falsihalocynthiibacter sp. S25ZX9 TaxID=3240870 RepID=UPI00350F45F9